MTFVQTFRARLLFILAILLIATLGVQYYLNVQTERQNERLRETQQQILVAGVSLAFNGLASKYRMNDFLERENQAFDQKTIDRIKDIIIINEDWEIYDSLDEDLLPIQNEKDETVYKKLKDINYLPPLINAARLGDDHKNFPNAEFSNDVVEHEGHAIPIETFKGRWYVMIILKTDKKETFQRAAEPLVYNLAVLLISTFVTILLVWRFTRPITQLSYAAKKVSQGDYRVRVDGAERKDELGQLASRFNEMTAELENKVELEAKLQEVEKSAVVGRLASAIAHEICNPLNYINLTLDQLSAKFIPDDQQKALSIQKMTSQLKTEVGKINQLISDFLRYSHPLKLDLQPTNLYQVIDRSLNTIKLQIEEQGIKVTISETENVSEIIADAEVLHPVFNHLLHNAIQAMPNGGSLTVTISNDGDSVKIEVSDTGNGISEENLTKIFEPYFSTKITGTGLGLAIAKRIIDEHNGAIEVESHLNQGTRFVVKLKA